MMSRLLLLSALLYLSFGVGEVLSQDSENDTLKGFFDDLDDLYDDKHDDKDSSDAEYLEDMDEYYYSIFPVSEECRHCRSIASKLWKILEHKEHVRPRMNKQKISSDLKLCKSRSKRTTKMCKTIKEGVVKAFQKGNRDGLSVCKTERYCSWFESTQGKEDNKTSRGMYDDEYSEDSEYESNYYADNSDDYDNDDYYNYSNLEAVSSSSDCDYCITTFSKVRKQTESAKNLEIPFILLKSCLGNPATTQQKCFNLMLKNSVDWVMALSKKNSPRDICTNQIGDCPPFAFCKACDSYLEILAKGGGSNIKKACTGGSSIYVNDCKDALKAKEKALIAMAETHSIQRKKPRQVVCSMLKFCSSASSH